MNKVLGPSPIRRSQKLIHTIRSSPSVVAKNVMRDLLSDYEEQVKGKVYKKTRKILGEKSNESYALASVLINESESKINTIVNCYGMKRDKVKQIKVSKITSRKEYKKG